MNEVIYTSPCGMYRVIEANGQFIPQEKRAIALGWGRLNSQAEIEEFKASGRWTVQVSPFEGWFLGRTQRGVSKGFRMYKSSASAIKYVNSCHVED